MNLYNPLKPHLAVCGELWAGRRLGITGWEFLDVGGDGYWWWTERGKARWGTTTTSKAKAESLLLNTQQRWTRVQTLNCSNQTTDGN